MLQLVRYGTSLVRHTKLRVLAREREQNAMLTVNTPSPPKINCCYRLHVSVSNPVYSFIYGGIEQDLNIQIPSNL